MLKLYLSTLFGQPLHHAVFSRHGFLRCGSLLKPRVKYNTLKNADQQGFSLLEMLVVIGLIGVVMLTTTTYLVDTSDIEDEKTVEENKLRWQHIQQAIVGNKNQYLDQTPTINSFVADMGVLPNNLKELVDEDFNYDDDNNALTPNIAVEQPAWQQHSLGINLVGSLWGGWRGPYLNRVGSQFFRDAWLNENSANLADDTLNFGWAVTNPTADSISVVSYGKDNLLAGLGVNEDFPSAAINIASASEWQISATSIGFNILLNKAPATDIPNLVLRLFFIEDGVLAQEASGVFTHAAGVTGATMHLVNVTPTTPAATVTLPMGKYAAVVWCSAASTPVVYDGDCDATNATNALPLTTLNPYYFTLLPNSLLPITIPWNLP